MGFFDSILDLLFPPKCVFCRKILHGAESVRCEKCVEKLPYTEFGSKLEGEYFDFCIAPFYYKDEARNSLMRFKFKNAPIIASAFGNMLAEYIVEHPDLWVNENNKKRPIYDIITWVPLSKKRKKLRGYDQAELIALATASALNYSATHVLKKVVETKPQSELSDATDRRANVDDAYEVIDSALVAGKCVLLIDDIVTTSSTLSECSKTLLGAGASRVICAVACKSL